jgi:hypothetical protein
LEAIANAKHFRKGFELCPSKTDADWSFWWCHGCILPISNNERLFGHFSDGDGWIEIVGILDREGL